MNLEQAIQVAYRSSAVACAAALAKSELATAHVQQAAIDRDTATPETPEHWEAINRYNLWVSFQTAQYYAEKFFQQGSGSPDSIGIRNQLELLWQSLGHDVTELPDWDAIIKKKPKEVVAFSEAVDWPTVEACQTAFKRNTGDITTSDFVTQFQEMFDHFVHDIWASEGMRRYTRDNLVRNNIPMEILEHWDAINGGAGAFFKNANLCCVKMANTFHAYKTGQWREEEQIAKYIYTQANKYNAVEGLWALDKADLPEAIRSKVEDHHVSLDG